MKEMKNTVLMVLEPQRPYMEWVAGLEEHLKANPAPVSQAKTAQKHSPDIASAVETTAVFIPHMSPEKLHEFLLKHCEELLNYEFSKWTENQELWPLRNDLEFLMDCFILKFYDNIVDGTHLT